ncbi:MAG: DegV family protein [Gammaproteobacteria bacterium]|nr:DegV family protein [Gammaproteobacteria bacterium]
MRIGICIDSACDLPTSFINAHNIEIMPINLILGDEKFVDKRITAETIEFYKRYSADKNLQGETEPLSVEDITDMFLKRLVLNYDRVLVLCLASTRSKIFENATKASFAILKGYKKARADAGIEGAFALRVVDTKTLFSGEAVLAHEVVRLIEEENYPFDKLRPRVEELSKHVHAYLIPNDLHYLRKAGRARGDRSISWLSYTLGTAMDIKPIVKAYRGDTFPVKKISGFGTAVYSLFDKARDMMKEGLMTNTICMSYAGNPDVIRQMSGYKTLEREAAKHGIKLMLTVMSTTAGMNVGPGSFAIGWISNKMGEKD